MEIKNYQQIITTYIQDSILVKEKLLKDENCINDIYNASQICLESIKKGFKIMLAGNGGSAADSQHIAAEFVSRFMFNRPALPALALTTDTSALLAIGNDYGFEMVFERQIESLGNEGDVFIGISTSGYSKNIIRAIKCCKERNITSIGLTGEGITEMDNLCDNIIKIPSKVTARIQESHILVGHIICGIIESNLFEN